jgi:hypothetical protein
MTLGIHHTVLIADEERNERKVTTPTPINPKHNKIRFIPFRRTGAGTSDFRVTTIRINPLGTTKDFTFLLWGSNKPFSETVVNFFLIKSRQKRVVICCTSQPFRTTRRMAIPRIKLDL